VWSTRLWNLILICTASVEDINERLKFNASCYLCGTVLLLSFGVKTQAVGKNHSALSTLFLLQRRRPALKWLFQQLASTVSANEYDDVSC
jgi:hypothetical protein